MCLGGGGGYQPPRRVQAPAPVAGPASPDDMVNNQVIENANPRDQQEAARNEFNPPSTPQPKTQSSLALGETTTPTPQRKSSRMGVAKRTRMNRRKN